jgi:hypothetical protein
MLYALVQHIDTLCCMLWYSILAPYAVCFGTAYWHLMLYALVQHTGTLCCVLWYSILAPYVVCFGTAYWHLIMKEKYFKCIDLFIVNVDRTKQNPLSTCIYHHLFNLKKKRYWMWLQHYWWQWSHKSSMWQRSKHKIQIMFSPVHPFIEYMIIGLIMCLYIEKK